MEVIELSWEMVSVKTHELYEKVKEDFIPDVVVFIAKGGFEIGRIISELFNCPMIEIKAARKKNFLKRCAEPILPYLPKSLCKILRKQEVGSGYHNKNQKRKVIFDVSQIKDLNSKKNVLLVDDSVDTGHSLKQCIDVINQKIKNCTIKTAALNVFSNSESNVKTDYYIFKDFCMSGPWSADSKELRKFTRNYNNWKKIIKKV